MSAPVVDVERIIAKAESQIGVTENPHGSNRTPYGEWYGMNGVAWCFIFVSWVLHHAGFPFLKMAWTPSGAAWARANDCWKNSSYTPKRGDIVFFDFPGDGVNRISHVGIVTGTFRQAGRLYVQTIEGNTNERGGRTGGKVMRHNRTVAGGIVGYLVVENKAKPKPPPEVKRTWLEVKPDFKDPDLAYFGGYDNQVTEVQLRLKGLAKRGDARIAKEAGIKLSDLADLGASGPRKDGVDGDFGPRSQAAAVAFKRYVRAFQRTFGVEQWPTPDTPNIGPKSIAMLRWMTA